jgi:hypothetical protein
MSSSDSDSDVVLHSPNINYLSNPSRFSKVEELADDDDDSVQEPRQPQLVHISLSSDNKADIDLHNNQDGNDDDDGDEEDQDDERNSRWQALRSRGDGRTAFQQSQTESRIASSFLPMLKTNTAARAGYVEHRTSNILQPIFCIDPEVVSLSCIGW